MNQAFLDIYFGKGFPKPCNKNGAATETKENSDKTKSDCFDKETVEPTVPAQSPAKTPGD